MEWFLLAAPFNSLGSASWSGSDLSQIQPLLPDPDRPQLIRSQILPCFAAESAVTGKMGVTVASPLGLDRKTHTRKATIWLR